MKRNISLAVLLLCLCIGYGYNKMPEIDDPDYTVEQLYDKDICYVSASFDDSYQMGGIKYTVDSDSIVVETTGPCGSVSLSVILPSYLFDPSSQHQFTFDACVSDNDMPFVLSYRFDKKEWDDNYRDMINRFDNIRIDNEGQSFAYDFANSYNNCQNVSFSITLRSEWNNYYLPSGIKFKISNISLKKFTKIPDWITLDVDKFSSFDEACKALQLDGSQVEFLKIDGQLSSEDLYKLRDMRSLIKLDISNTKLDEIPYGFLMQQDYYSRLKIDEIWLPQNIDSIPNNSFYNCICLKKIHSSQLRYIGDYSFAGTNIMDIDLSVAEYIGKEAFSSANLQSLSLPDGMETIGYKSFCRNRYLKEVTLGKDFKEIGASAFEYCSTLNKIGLPDGLLHLGAHAFDHTALRDLTLPSSTELVMHDLINNTALTVTSLSPAPPATYGASIFGSKIKELKVPRASMKTYGSTSAWMYPLEPIDTIIGDFSVVQPASLNLILNQSYKPNVELKYLNINQSKLLDVDGNFYSTLEYVGELTLEAESQCRFSDFVISPSIRLTRNDIKLTYDYGRSVRDIPTLINNSHDVSADNITLNMPIKSKVWHFISLPFECNVMDITPAPNVMWTIRRYDSAARASGDISNAWVNLNPGETLKPFFGYILSAIDGANVDATPILTFRSSDAGTFFDSNDRTISLSEYESEFVQNQSWNFIGNPYPSYYNMHFANDGTGQTFTSPITLWRGDSYTAYSPVDDDILLRPYEAFFVQCPATDTKMVFTRDGCMHFSDANFAAYNGATPGIKSPTKTEILERSVFNFNLKSSATESIFNRARITFNESSSMDYEIGKDALKFMDTTDDAPLLYVSADINYEICERPYGDGTAFLAISTPFGGQYEIDLTGKFHSDWSVILTDLLNDNIVDLTSQSYTFISEPQYAGTRFMVNFESNNHTDGLTKIEDADDSDDVTVFSTIGLVVYQGQRSGFKCLIPGTYIVKCKNSTYKVVFK